MKKTNFLGWTITFKDETNDMEYSSEIVDLAIGQDILSSIVMCTIKFSIDSSFLKYFVKQHTGTLTLINKLIYTDEPEEIFMVKLQSVSNVGSAIHREDDQTQSNIISLPVRYMCCEGVKLMNKRVGGVYEDKNLKQIISDLYDQAGVDLPLKLEEPTNTNTYKSLMVRESSFIEAVRYLNQQYGLYDNLFLMFGETFSDEDFNWVISCVNKIGREEVNLILTNMQHRINGTNKTIDERTYYTFLPLNIKNNFEQLIKRVPKVAKFTAFDDEKFWKRQDIPFAQTLKEMNFISANKQFDELMELDTKLYNGTSFDIKDYAAKDMIQKVGLSAFQVPDITIPNPFKLSHFKLGTIINFQSQSMGFSDADVKLLVLGWLLRITQGNGIGGGAAYQTTFKVRTAATSYLGND